MKIDIEITGTMGMYRVVGLTDSGREWLTTNVHFEGWQGDALNGIVVDGSRLTQEIADGAIEAGLAVDVNGREYEQSNI